MYALWKELGLKVIRALRITVETTAIIFLILIGAKVFGFVLFSVKSAARELRPGRRTTFWHCCSRCR